MTTYNIYRDYTDDGVIGLNGKQWLNNPDDSLMNFNSINEAVDFLHQNGIDIIDDDLMHIYEKQYDDGRHTTEFFGMTTADSGWKLIKTIDLFDANEPNWENIQNGI